MYLVFEYVDRNLLELLEENTNGIDVSDLCVARATEVFDLSIDHSDKLLPLAGCHT